MRCSLRIPDSTNYQRADWKAGLTAAGYTVCDFQRPEKGDLLVIWNRSHRDEQAAQAFEAVGGHVLVAENGYLGKWWNGHKWFALSANHHNGAGWIPHLPERWDRYAVPFGEWRRTGSEIVALPQRGIGEVGVAMPRDWKPPVKCRIRPHMGIKPCVDLAEDLQNARAVVTWGSGAAIKCLLWGIPVFYEFPQWIGRLAATHTSIADYDRPWHPDRLPVFQKVLSGMWTDSEIRSGQPFEEFKRARFGDQPVERVKRVLGNTWPSAW